MSLPQRLPDVRDADDLNLSARLRQQAAETHPRSAGRTDERLVSVVIAVRDAAADIGRVVSAVLGQTREGLRPEVIVVDDGSRDGTAEVARSAGAYVISLPYEALGSPARARNVGARAANGDPIVFLDADCIPAPGWLAAIVGAHDMGATVVGGALDLPPGLSPSARCDYYCGWYLVHSGVQAGWVPHHPPPNLSVRREAFATTSGFSENAPLEYSNEERKWQGELRAAGHRIWFEPRAVAYHYNRPGIANLFRRSYRWAYTAVEAKGESGAARLSWLWRRPRFVVLASVPLAMAQALFILGCWARAGRAEVLLMAPVVIGSRLAYAAGLSVGGWRWLRRRRRGGTDRGPEWR